MATITSVDVNAEMLMKQLAILRDVVNSKEVVAAERKAAKMLMDRGYNQLVVTLKGNSDNLINSFTYKLRNGKESMSGIRVGFKRPGGNTAHLVDRGTDERYTRTGAYRGRITGSRFWTDTTNTYAPIAMNDMVDAVEAAIKKITG